MKLTDVPVREKITIDGITGVCVRFDEEASCENCVFNNDINICNAIACMSHEREDENEVYFRCEDNNKEGGE